MFLSQIYAFFGVPFRGLKNMVAYQKWQIWGMPWSWLHITTLDDEYTLKLQEKKPEKNVICNWGHKEAEQCLTNVTQIYRDGSKYAVNVQNTAKHTTK